MTAPTATPTAVTAPVQGDRSGIVIFAIVAAMAAAGLALFAGGSGGGGGSLPLDPDSTKSGGARAMVLLLEELGASVEVADEVRPGQADRVLLIGRGTEARDEAVAVAASDGIVVVDPFALGEESVDRVFGAEPTGDCSIGALAGLGELVIFEGSTIAVTDGDRSCYGDGDAALVVARPAGSGALVMLGSAEIAANAAIGEAPNAALLAELLVPERGTRVMLVRSDPDESLEELATGGRADDEGTSGGSGGDTLFDLVPSWFWRILLATVIVVAVIAIYSGRRFGPPIIEPALVELPASELALASGRLHFKTKDATLAGSRLRASARRDLGRSLGVGSAAEPHVIAAAAALASGHADARTDPEPIERLLTDASVADDAALVDLGSRLDALRAAVLAPTAALAPTTAATPGAQ